MKRRSLDVEGCVLFPAHLPSTGEGGMFVKLWVIDRQDFDHAYGVCAGVGVWDVKTESFQGSDKAPYPDTGSVYDNCTTQEHFLRAQEQERKAQFNYLDQFFVAGDAGEQSVPLLASIVLGSTGWSGDFVCKYENLAPEGKAIYDAMAKLYPKAELHLMTFLDT